MIADRDAIWNELVQAHFHMTLTNAYFLGQREVQVYGPLSADDEKERDEFWNRLPDGGDAVRLYETINRLGGIDQALTFLTHKEVDDYVVEDLEHLADCVDTMALRGPRSKVTAVA